MSEQKVATQLDYKQTSMIHPEYKFSKIYQQTGSQTVTVSTAGNAESVFEIPVQAMNLSKSVLSFTLTPAAAGGANTYNYTFMDCAAPISQIQLYTQGGTYIVDINKANDYTKVVWKPETKLQDFLDMPNHDAGDGWGQYLQKCNANNQGNLSTASRYYRVTTDSAGAASAGGNDGSYGQYQITATNAGDVSDEIALAINAVGNSVKTLVTQPSVAARRHTDATLPFQGTGGVYVNVAYKEAKYLAVGAVNDPTPVINVKLPLGMFYNSLLALDKDMYFGEVLYLRVVWAASTKVLFRAVNANGLAGPATAAAAYNNNYDLTNLQLFLCLEKNQLIVNSLIQKVMSGGMNLLVPYVHTSQISFTGAGVQSQVASKRYNRGHGQRLLKIYHAIFDNTEATNVAFDHSSMAGNRACDTFHTTLDNVRQQEYEITVANDEDYMQLKDRLKGSAILNSDIYHYNWFWLDSWDHGCDNNENVACGLDLTSEHTWNFETADAQGPQRHVTFAITQRTLSITPQGMSIS